ncbi:MAG: oligosaccharide flippase family protein [Hyphomicrobiaceae bacterium]
MTLKAQRRRKLLAFRIAGQGAMLFTGFALAQACSFARNAALGYILSRGDFGIAAALTVTLQLIETLSDIGADRLLVQAEDGEQAGMLATAHTLLIARGLVTAVILYLAARPTTAFFRLEQHLGLFEALALVPLIRGFVHLDQRRRQRQLDNSSYLATEVGSQALALAMLPFLLWLSPGPHVVIWTALVQAVGAVKLSHALAQVSWRIDFNRERIKRFLAFGWPIWLSAFPLMIVYQADRFLVGRAYGMETLAAYSAAFMVTMVPGLVAAKVGHALMLPLLSDRRDNLEAFTDRYRLMYEATVLLAAAYLMLFMLIGGTALAIAFGPNYRGLDTVVAWLAVMWAVRMIQAPPGMALMAAGTTKPLLWAGLIRASALPLSVAAALLGWGVEGIAAAGVAGEVASLIYVAIALRQIRPELFGITLGRGLVLIPVGAAGLLLLAHSPPDRMTLAAILQCFGALAAIAVVGLLVMPELRRAARRRTRPARAEVMPAT